MTPVITHPTATTATDRLHHRHPHIRRLLAPPQHGWTVRQRDNPDRPPEYALHRISADRCGVTVVHALYVCADDAAAVVCLCRTGTEWVRTWSVDGTLPELVDLLLTASDPTGPAEAGYGEVWERS
ncbi:MULTISPECIES: hypothetical protein [unclassified Crossiella]|uniref:hypothetical protein n=1 Tax=unclassified Crossiella TaxID=2620835 RepID=UPI00200005F9|nr:MULTISPECIES: hypothetical protein [unclassified Crossiella]MCK2244840.1 hypothetical protein [Crossiella sp. S99.2]MCK2258482.1 hypothetical protein [Crossiella sp. S99.1]